MDFAKRLVICYNHTNMGGQRTTYLSQPSLPRRVFYAVKHFFSKARKFFKNIKTWQLIVVLIPLLFLAATLLRFDHIHMTELRDAVMAADEAEDDDAIAAALSELKDFTTHNVVINIFEKNGGYTVVFGTRPLYLEHQYQRKAAEKIAEAEKKAAKFSDSNPNGNVFAKAMKVCKPKAIANGWAWNSPGYINCFTTEINKYPTSDALDNDFTASIPSTALYRYDFASPVWAPTFSGVVILLCLILIIIIILRFMVWLVLRLVLHFLK